MTEIICTRCPLGCWMEVEPAPEGGFLVKGNSCKRGVDHAVAEMTTPERTVTTTVRLSNGLLVPVKTAGTVPKERVFDVLAALRRAVVAPPVRLGDVVAADVCGTGVDVVATRGTRTQGGRDGG